MVSVCLQLAAMAATAIITEVKANLVVMSVDPTPVRGEASFYFTELGATGRILSSKKTTLPKRKFPGWLTMNNGYDFALHGDEIFFVSINMLARMSKLQVCPDVQI